MSDGEQNIQSGRDTTQAGREVTQIGGDKVGGDKYSPLHQRRAPVPDFVGRAEEYAGAVAHCQHADEEAMMHTMNPYVGPRPFQQGETIYGRDHEVHDLAGLLVAAELLCRIEPARDEIVVLAGEAYREPLARLLTVQRCVVYTPLVGLGIGQQMAWLKTCLVQKGRLS